MDKCKICGTVLGKDLFSFVTQETDVPEGPAVCKHPIHQAIRDVGYYIQDNPDGSVSEIQKCPQCGEEALQ